MSILSLEEVPNLIQREVQRQMALIARNRHLLVTSYDKNAHAVKGTFVPENHPSGWIPIITLGASVNGISVQVGPTPGDGVSSGDLAVISYAEADPEAAHVVGFLHNLIDQAPGAESGQHVVKHNPTGLLRIIDKLGHYISATGAGQVINHIATAIMHLATTGDITHTAQQGNIVHVAQQGNIAHSATGPTSTITQTATMGITNTAEIISFAGSQSIAMTAPTTSVSIT